MKNFIRLITCAAVMGVASIASADDIGSGSSALVLTDQQMEVISAGRGGHCYGYCYGHSVATAGANAEAYGKNTLAATATNAIAAPGFAGASSVSVAAAGP